MARLGNTKTLWFSVGSLLFAYLIYRVGPWTILTHLWALGWKLPIIFLPYLIVYLLDTEGWRYTLGKGTLPFQKLFAIRMAGEAFNHLTPLAYLGGEPLKASLLRRHGIPLDQGLASVVVAKTVMTLAQLIFVTWGIALALWQVKTQGLVFAGSMALVVLGMPVLLLFTAQQRGLFAGLLKLMRKLKLPLSRLEKREGDFRSLDGHILSFYRQNRRGFAISFLLYFAGWTAGSLEVYLLLRFLGMPISLLTALSIEALSTLTKAAAFFIPASLGAQEGGNILIFLSFALSFQAGMTFSVVRRARELFWVALGLLSLASHKQRALGPGFLPGPATSFSRPHGPHGKAREPLRSEGRS